MDLELNAAIAHLQYVRFTYDGLQRIVEPHVLGKSGGKLQLLAYQVDGGSHSGSLPRWRRFDVAKMNNLQVLGQHFPAPRPSPTGNEAPFDVVFAAVGGPPGAGVPH
ncbi:MAG TPA: WYL domain-containing protein [Candidatus Thermoplasmatota archaeon]|nr:WYL domain-containing protein [Candidatus Thermoplasmatota archaeon]